MNRFFDDLGERWVAAAGRRSAQIEPPTLDAELALELLELARVAARTQERRFAPLACYMAGVAAERLRAATEEKLHRDRHCRVANGLEIRQYGSRSDDRAGRMPQGR